MTGTSHHQRETMEEKEPINLVTRPAASSGEKSKEKLAKVDLTQPSTSSDRLTWHAEEDLEPEKSNKARKKDDFEAYFAKNILTHSSAHAVGPLGPIVQGLDLDNAVWPKRRRRIPGYHCKNRNCKFCPHLMPLPGPAPAGYNPIEDLGGNLIAYVALNNRQGDEEDTDDDDNPLKDPQDDGFSPDQVFAGLRNMGFQATMMTEACRIINLMGEWTERIPNPEHPEINNRIVLSFTSNLISSGLRDNIRFLVQHKKCHIIICTAGAVEEDLIKCLGPTYVSTFRADDAALRAQATNRIGNLRVPNDNYVAFEDWVMPQLQRMLDEQEASERHIDGLKWAVMRESGGGFSTSSSRLTESQAQLADAVPLTWTPSKIIARLGEAINDEKSFIYWAYRHQIPVFCPAITDGSLGDMISAFAVRTRARAPFPAGATSPIPRSPRGLVIDIAEDIDRLNSITRETDLYGAKMGAIILGAGLVKHHTMNAFLNGGGGHAVVYINTAAEWDGSDAGAECTEAVSWGKLRAGAPAIKVTCDATIAFPLLILGTWLKHRLE